MYENILGGSYLSASALRSKLDEAIQLVGQFENLAEELGIDPMTNEAYEIVKEHVDTLYPDLIGMSEEAEMNAQNYFDITEGLQ